MPRFPIKNDATKGRSQDPREARPWIVTHRYGRESQMITVHRFAREAEADALLARLGYPQKKEVTP
jgi:hypothetical protein